LAFVAGDRYRPARFAAMLASLAEPEPETNAETDNEPATE